MQAGMDTPQAGSGKGAGTEPNTGLPGTARQTCTCLTQACPPVTFPTAQSLALEMPTSSRNKPGSQEGQGLINAAADQWEARRKTRLQSRCGFLERSPPSILECMGKARSYRGPGGNLRKALSAKQPVPRQGPSPTPGRRPHSGDSPASKCMKMVRITKTHS